MLKTPKCRLIFSANWQINQETNATNLEKYAHCEIYFMEFKSIICYYNAYDSDAAQKSSELLYS